MRPLAFTLLAALVAVSGCGVRRPLVRPADVPAYEAERAKRRAQLEDNSPNPIAQPEEQQAPATQTQTPPPATLPETR